MSANDNYDFVTSIIPPENIDKFTFDEMYPLHTYLNTSRIQDSKIIKYLATETTVNYIDFWGTSPLADYIRFVRTPDFEVIKLLANEMTIYNKDVDRVNAIMLCRERAMKSCDNVWIICHKYLQLFDNYFQ